MRLLTPSAFIHVSRLPLLGFRAATVTQLMLVALQSPLKKGVVKLTVAVPDVQLVILKLAEVTYEMAGQLLVPVPMQSCSAIQDTHKSNQKDDKLRGCAI